MKELKDSLNKNFKINSNILVTAYFYFLTFVEEDNLVLLLRVFLGLEIQI